MRIRHTHWFVFLTLMSSSIALCGCGRDAAPKVPESGSVQQFLDENPGYQESSDLEAASEEEEFEAAGTGE